MKLDSAAPQPLYQQLRDTLLVKIEAGEYAPHQQLPSERQLSRFFRVSRVTVRQALADLIQTGHVYTRVGKGTYVSDPSSRQPLGSFFGFSEGITRYGHVSSSVILEAKLVPADEALSVRLRMPHGDEIVRLVRLHEADGIPMVLETIHLPHGHVPGVLRRIADDVSLYEVLEKNYSLRMASAEVRMEAGLADEKEAEHLALSLPAAVLRIEQTSFTADGRAVAFSRSTCRGEGYQFNAILHRSHQPVTDPNRSGTRPAT